MNFSLLSSQHRELKNSTIPLPDKGQELLPTARRPGEVDAVVVSCWAHDVTTAAAQIPLSIVGNAKAATEAAQSPEKKPKGWIPSEPPFSKQGLSSLCSPSFYCCHKQLLSSLKLLVVTGHAGMQEMQGILSKIIHDDDQKV